MVPEPPVEFRSIGICYDCNESRIGVYTRCIYYYLMGLYGIYGTHTQEACPLYNAESRKYLLRVAPTLAKDAEKNNVNMLYQFHSALEHTFLWVAEAENAQIIEEVMARTGGRFNTIRIVTIDNIPNSYRKVQDGRRWFILPRKC